MRLYELFDLEEKYTRVNAFIRDYFRNREFDAYRYDWQMKEWLNDNADEYDVEWSEEEVEDDPQAVFNTLPKDVQDQMVRDIYDDLRDNFPTELPSTEFFQDGKLIPRNTWLVHFSYHARDDEQQAITHPFSCFIESLDGETFVSSIWCDPPQA